MLTMKLMFHENDSQDNLLLYGKYASLSEQDSN